MEPLAALGLASNVLQFVEFSSNIVRDASKVYHSASGLPAELEDVAIITGSLESYMGRLSPPALLPSAPPDDKALATLVSNCQKTCGELNQLVERMEGKNPGSRKDSFRVAWKSLRGKGKLEELEKRLDRYRSQILSQLVHMLREENQEHKTRLQTQQTKDEVHAMEMKQDIREIREKVLTLVNSETHNNPITSESGATVSYEDVLQDIRGALSDMSSKMRTAGAEELISNLLWFPDLPSRFDSIEDPHGDTYRWLLHEPDDDSDQDLDIQSLPPSSSSYESDHASVTSQQSDDQSPEVELSDNLQDDSDRYSTRSSIRSEKEKLQRQAWRGQFLDWLQNGNGLFYMSGKPGSGKSTLLKYVSQDSRTRQLLEAWASMDAKDIILVRFFFWNSGTKEQKTIEGLYRSILWEVLQSRPDLTQQIFPGLWQRACEGLIHESDLNKHTLQAAFQLLVSNQELLGKLKLCFFIDGLDECQEDRWHLAKELKRWCTAPDVKLCVSGRPYNEFLKAFTPNTGSWLKLHELNQEDILKVVHGQFAGDERFVEARETSKHGTDYDELADAIIQKADGVFIWVIMVISSLLRDIGNSCSLPQLRKRLDAVPAGVNAMFQYMLDGIDQFERQATARTFLVMKTAQSIYKMWVYIHAVLNHIVDDPEYESSLLNGKLQPCSEGRYGTSACVSMSHRLNGRCRGLVQVETTSLPFPYCRRVYFIHRSFSDFLGEPETAQQLSKMAGEFSPDRSLALGLLALTKHVPWKEWKLQCQGYQHTQAFGAPQSPVTNAWSGIGRSSIYRTLLDLAARIESTNSSPITAEIESMKHMLVQLWTSVDFLYAFNSTTPGKFWSITALRPSEHEDFALLIAMRSGVFEYVKIMVRDHNLDAAVCSQLLFLCSSETITGGDRHVMLEKIVEMSRFLLERHASLNFELRNVCVLEANQKHGTSLNRELQCLSSPPWTPWTAFLMEISHGMFKQKETHSSPKWIRLLGLYSEYGFDANVCFVGYRLPQTNQGPHWTEEGFNKIIESNLADKEKEILETNQMLLYADLPTMLEIWDLGVSLPSKPWISKMLPVPRELLGGCLGMLTSGSYQCRKVGSDEIQRWNFLVLRVASHRRLREVKRSDLEDTLRQV
ncbi:hypothetical protein K456DRAFT_46501, partial [Colletotrichum gloeosporioides 23]